MTVEHLEKAERYEEATNLLDHILEKLKEDGSLAAISVMDTFREMSKSYVHFL